MPKNQRHKRTTQNSNSRPKPRQEPDQKKPSPHVIEADVLHPEDDHPMPDHPLPEEGADGKLVVGHETKPLPYKSPYPPPEVLKLYEQVSPGSVERIINMAEKEQEHVHTMELTALKAMKTEKRRGQRFGLVACIMALGITAYALHLGHPTAATVIGGATLVSIVGIFVVGRRQRQIELKQGKPQH